MNTLKLFSGGFPMTIETLAFLQEAYTKPLSALSKMAGNNAILDGIVTTGASISEGFFVQNKEVIYFKPSVVGATVKIVEKTLQVPYNEDTNADGNLDLKDAYVTRYATTNDPIDADEVLVSSFPLSDLVRISDFRNLTPVGAAMLWFDPVNIPAGWAVCDGNNGTPDLRNKFIKMAGSEDLPNTASGSRTKTLSPAHIPPHTHSIPSHTHPYNDLFFSEIGGGVSVPGNVGSGDSDNDNSGFQMARTTGSGGAGNTGNGAPALNGNAFNIEPAYYAAIWIQYKGL